MASSAPALERFRRVQADPGAGFDAALAEIRAGHKRGHWIWYVFPQLEGLGSSPMSTTYAIHGVEEAQAYLQDPELGTRLATITAAVAEQVDRGVPLRRLMGSEIDVLKLVSSLTLFGHAARTLGAPDARAGAMVAASEEILRAAAAAGVPPCAFTLARLTREP